MNPHSEHQRRIGALERKVDRLEKMIQRLIEVAERHDQEIGDTASYFSNHVKAHAGMHYSGNTAPITRRRLTF